MPRKGRGGARQGTPGQAYGQRTDLNASMPIQTATGQGYGVAAEQRAAQRAIPVAAQPVAGATANAPMAPAQAPAPAQATPTTVSSQLSPQPQATPGSLLFLHPSDRPNEPVTAGVPFGDGPGPESLPIPNQDIAGTLGGVARQSRSPLMMDLANAASVLGL